MKERMTTTVYLGKDSVSTILKIMDDHRVDRVRVTTDSSSGIGQITKVAFDTQVNDWNAEVTIDITDIQKW